MSEEKPEVKKTHSIEEQPSNDSHEMEPKLSKWAKASYLCGFLALGIPIGILIFLTSLDMCIPLPFFSAKRILEEVLGRIMVGAPPIFGTIALITGVVALVMIRLKKGTIRGTRKAVAGILLGLFLFVMMYGVMMLGRVRQMAVDNLCQRNLGTLGKAIQLYATEHDNKYPTANNWCDFLMQNCNLAERDFFCGASGQEYGNYPVSYYAVNPNADMDSPPDLVLLFETKGGWNQVGGPELITAENHRGRGSYVLFNDGHVEFVKKRRFGKLRWQVVEVTTEGKPDGEKNK